MTAQPVPLVVNDWTIFGHPLFIDQLELLHSEVLALSQKDPDNFHKKNAAKRARRNRASDAGRDPTGSREG